MKRIIFYLALACLIIISSCNKYEEPSIVTITPKKGPVETLITIEGSNFEDITSLTFNQREFSEALPRVYTILL